MELGGLLNDLSMQVGGREALRCGAVEISWCRSVSDMLVLLTRCCSLISASTPGQTDCAAKARS